jgi:ATP-binding cassette subfamily F protein 3
LEDLKQQIDDVQKKMEEHTDHTSAEYNDLVELFGDLYHRFDHHGGYSIQSQVSTVLDGLGFLQSDHGRLTQEFSGGWQMRIALAKLLLQTPDLLLLDEPTNHLDIESLTWLEDWLQSYGGAILMVSHDRRFLDNITKRTIEISAGDVFAYDGNYSTYVRVSAERRELLKAAFNNQQKKIADIEKFVERFRYKATKARQVQSRVKMLEKMQRIELEEENRSQIHFEFPAAPNSGVVPVEIVDATKMYDELLVFENINIKIERGDKIAFLGRNGEGKSTMAKVIAGIEPLTFGECKYGYNVSVAYFAQQQAEALDGNKMVLATLDEGATGEVRTKLRSLLGAFLFQGDDAFKYVRVLSGGEKSRLALAKMLLQPSNLLILDEPTNHLDMRSKAVLKEALQKFNGTILVVSHDRDFLDGLVNKVLEFKDHNVKEYLGGLQDWQWKKQQLEAQAKADALAKTTSKKAQAPKFPDKAQDKPKDKRSQNGAKNNNDKKLKLLKDKISKLEKNISATETKKTEIEAVMANPDFYKDGGKSKEVLAEYNTLKEALNSFYFEWAEVNEEMERAGK